MNWRVNEDHGGDLVASADVVHGGGETVFGSNRGDREYAQPSRMVRQRRA